MADVKQIDEDKLTEGQCDSVETCVHGEPKGIIDEDWLALILGLVIFLLSLGVFQGMDILGWGASAKTWIDPAKSSSPVSKHYQHLKGEITKIDGAKITFKKKDGKEDSVTVQKEEVAKYKVGDTFEQKGVSPTMSLILTYLFMMGVMAVGAVMLRSNVARFCIGFTIVFWISYLCWFMGHFAYIAATKDKLTAFNIPWSLSMTGEFGFIIALLAGLIVGNFFPKLSDLLKEAAKPELYIKTAIVIMGATLGLKAAQSFGLATNIMFRGLCAIVEAYLIYWAFVYWVSRKYFKFSREWSAPLASGISICGVSAAIATGGAIRARPVVPIMVSSLVVIFVAVEMVLLPFIAQVLLYKEPLVAGAWMGLAVKSDGGAIASGAITDALIRAKALDVEGINYADGWITMTATTVKMFIDIFIGVWAFVLAIMWCTYIDCKEGQKVNAVEIWHRFPKFVIGYILTFFILLAICWPAAKVVGPAQDAITKLDVEVKKIEKQISIATDPLAKSPLEAKLKEVKAELKSKKDSIKEQDKTLKTAKAATSQGDVFRKLFFLLCFFTIGVVSNFKKLMEEGIGKLAAVYGVCLFGFIIWVALVISWLFFHGVKPPIIQ